MPAGRPHSPVPQTDWFTVEIESPQKPSLKSHASDEWDRISGYLIRMKRLSRLDAHALAEYCMLWQQFIELRKGIADEGDKLSRYGTKYMVEQPLLKPLLQTAESLMLLCVAFGMTPKSRDLTKVSNNTKPDEVKRLMGNPGKRAIGTNVAEVLEWSEEDIKEPGWMPERAREHFIELRDSLAKSNMVTPLDLAALAITCVVHDLFQLANEQRKNLWTEVTDKEGETVEMKAHPITMTSSNLSRIGDRLRRHFGMSPKYRKILNEDQLQKKKIPLRFGA